MASRRVALIGAERGPWIPMRHITAPRVRITGLRDAKVVAETRAGEQEYTEDGEHELAKSDWVRLRCEPRCPSVICEILSRESAHAIQRS